MGRSKIPCGSCQNADRRVSAHAVDSTEQHDPVQIHEARHK